MQTNIRNLLGLFGIAGVFICALLIAFFPTLPQSVLGWAALIFVGIPVWIFLEWLGERMLGMKFFSRLSSPARIILAVPFVIVLIAVAVLLVSFVQRLGGL